WQTLCRIAPSQIHEQLSGFAPAPTLDRAVERFLRVRARYAPDRIQRLYNAETADRPSRVQTGTSRTLQALREARVACLLVLGPSWLEAPLDQAYGDTPAKPDAASNLRSPWLLEVERFVALGSVYDINRAAIHLRVLATILAVVPLLLLASSAVYPLQPQRFLSLVLWSLLLTVVGTVMWVYVQMERNEILSRVACTTPNRVNLDGKFLANILTYLIPLIGLVLARFPYVSDSLSGWFEPLARVIR
ncbi:MAG TPA: hypothetical protein VFT74_10840, partial [Isosphaeraceae bacterium]|nr:hypothetical protein [Isosphaeraceae bacterium]